ncbi:hypothetical protein FALBO_2879 [Fusarium albosuccineum]|uniref:Uncharacterized protein n=1 Tax=Fusarium albosuccineum TaxID=1237068 RepID=A0A8H4PLB5_9HYPO|nr:hypothetical protein FALBO_2879 [Fusarium albosuccineum]
MNVNPIVYGVTAKSLAFTAFPTLERFRPNFHPGRKTIVLPLNQDGAYYGVLPLRNALRTIYHDIGVLVYAGASTAQVQKIARLLPALVDPDRGLRHRPEKLKDVEYRYKRYRLKAHYQHTNKGFYPKRGFLSTAGLLNLCQRAVQTWSDEVQHNYVENNDSTLTLRQRDVTLKPDIVHAGGIIHETIKSHHYLPVDAYLQIDPSDRLTFNINVQLFAVGTGHFLGMGTIGVAAFVTDEEGSGQRVHCKNILQYTPQSTGFPGTASSIRPTMSNLYKLERQIWGDKVPQGAGREDMKKSRRRGQPKTPVWGGDEPVEEVTGEDAPKQQGVDEPIDEVIDTDAPKQQSVDEPAEEVANNDTPKQQNIDEPAEDTDASKQQSVDQPAEDVIDTDAPKQQSVDEPVEEIANEDTPKQQDVGEPAEETDAPKQQSGDQPADEVSNEDAPKQQSGDEPVKEATDADTPKQQ